MGWVQRYSSAGVVPAFVVVPTISTNSLPSGEVALAYSDTLMAFGGAPPYRWSASGLPAGLTCSSGGVISGTPTASGNFNVTLHLTDSNSTPALPVTIGLFIQTQPQVTTSSLPSGSVGTAYSFQLTATGGTPGYTWSEVGALPAGLTMSSSGLISGTPTANVTTTPQFTATDTLGVPSPPVALTLSVGGALSQAPEAIFTGYIDSQSAMISAFPPVSSYNNNNFANAAFTGSISGGVLTVTAMVAITTPVPGANPPTINSGDALFTTAPNKVVPGCYIGSQIGGTPGGVGTYNLVAGPNGPVPAVSGTFYTSTVAYYNLYENSNLVNLNATGMAWPGFSANPSAPAGQGAGTYTVVPWVVATGLTAGAAVNLQASAVINGLESALTSVLPMTVRPNGGSIKPTPAIEPSTWVPALPTGSYSTSGICVYVCSSTTDTTTGSPASGAGIKTSGWGLQAALNDSFARNPAGGDLFVMSSGVTYPTTGAASVKFTLPSFTGPATTIITTDQDPLYNATGKLVPYNYTQLAAPYQVISFNAPSGSIPIGAVSATLAPNQTGFTDASGNWIARSGWYTMVFIEGLVEEERLASFVNGSPTVHWDTDPTTGSPLNALYPVNGISSVGSLTGGAGTPTGVYSSQVLTGGTGTQGALATATSTAGTLSAVTIYKISGNNYTVGDVLTGAGCHVNVTGFISGTAFTQVTGSQCAIGTALSGGGVLAGTSITGGAFPNFTVNNSQTVGSAGSPATITATGASFTVTVTAIAGKGPGLNAACNNAPGYGTATTVAVKVEVLNQVTPADIPFMPTISWGVQANSSCFAFTQPQAGSGNATTNVRFIGLNIAPALNLTQNSSALTGFSWANVNNNANPLPTEGITIDRCIIGQDTNNLGWNGGMSHALAAVNGHHTLVHGTYFWGCCNRFAFQVGDAQCMDIAGGGPYAVRNCHGQAGTETFITGGLFMPNGKDFPHDIVYEDNWFHRPLSWLTGYNFPVIPGTPWALYGQACKNHLEFKGAQNVTIRRNLIQNAWMAAIQSYHSAGVMTTPRSQLGGAGAGPDQYMPYAHDADFDIHDNWMYRIGAPHYAFSNETAPTPYTARCWVHNNQCLIDPPNNDGHYGERVHGFSFELNVTDELIENNTCIVNTNSVQGLSGSQLGCSFASGNAYITTLPYSPNPVTLFQDGMTWRNNIIDSGTPAGSVTSNIAWSWALGTTLPGFGTYTNFTVGGNVTINDPTVYQSTTPTLKTWMPGTTSNIGGGGTAGYAACGFKNFAGNSVIPMQPSDWNVVSGALATASVSGALYNAGVLQQASTSTGGPVGYSSSPATPVTNPISVNLPTDGTAIFSVQDFPLFQDRVREADGFNVAVGSDGWPSTSSGTWTLTLHAGNTVQSWMTSGPFHAGFTGSGAETVSINGGTLGTVTRTGADVTFTFTVTSATFGFNVGNLSTPVKNIFAYLPAYAANAPATPLATNYQASPQLITTEAKNHYGQFQVIRCMFAENAWYNTTLTTSANRHTPANTKCRYGSSGWNASGNSIEGYPVEWFIDLANAAGCGLWINSPINEDGTWSSAVATLLANNIPAGRKIFIEIGNENWNGNGTTFNELSTLATAAGLNTHQMTAKLIHTQAQTFKTAFGSRFGTDLNIVCAWNSGGGGLSFFFDVYTYMQGQGWLTSDIHYLSFAPYLHPGVAGGDTIATIQSKITSTSATNMQGNLGEHTAIMNLSYGGKGLVCYESGWDSLADWHTSGNNNIGPAILDSGMNAAMQPYWSNLLNFGAQMVVNFEGGVNNSNAGAGAAPDDQFAVNYATFLASGAPRLSALQVYMPGGPKAYPLYLTRNVVSGSGSVIQGGNYEDQVNAAAPAIGPTATFLPTPHYPGSGYSAWLLNCTAPGTYTLTINTSGGAATTNVEVNGTVLRTGVAVAAGNTALGQVTLLAGANYVALGNGSSQTGCTVNSLTFT